jgi:hypothetical protein
MNILKYFPYFLLLCYLLFFTATISFAQTRKIEMSEGSQVVFNPKNNSFVLFNDSTHYLEYKIDQPEWKKTPYVYEGEISFKKLKQNFVPICTENGSYYFIVSGIGEVYKLVNDTLKRIDDSFNHQNQYGGTIFSFNNKIYCFGGYGIFTFKNMITFFDENIKEWFCVNRQFDEIMPNPRTDCVSQLIGNRLYIGRGNFGIETIIGVKNVTFNDVWYFDLKKSNWKKLGIMKDITISPLIGTTNIYSNVLRAHQGVIHDFDFKKNKLKKYFSEEFTSVNYILEDSSKNFLCIIQNAAYPGRQALVITKKEFLKEPISDAPLYYAEKEVSSLLKNPKTYFMTGFALLIILVPFYFKKKKSKRESVLESNLFSLQNGEVYFNNEPINSSFSPIDVILLTLFQESENNTLELAKINQVLEFDQATQETIKKRREVCIKALRQKISRLTDIPVEDVFIELKNHNDKRIKLLKLNPLLIN